MILAVIRGDRALRNRRYRQGWTLWPIHPEEERPQTEVGSNLYGTQRGGRQDPVANKGAGILNLPGYLAASGQASSTAAGTEGERTGGQTGMVGVPEIIVS